MQITLAILGLFGASCVGAAPPAHETPNDLLQDLNSQALDALKKAEVQSNKRSTCQKCSVSETAVRRDWKVLSDSEKKSYISAVQCLREKPSKADPAFAPGARSRYDDFVAVHINQTLSIHGTGNFLTWHRYFTWAYETALRDECDYEGYQPYWNWFETSDFDSDPVFDGSETSMGGDGEYIEHDGALSGTGNIYIPSGNGGGCIESGPFVGAMANLGPPSPGMDGMEATTTPLEYNPRCLRRDLSRYPIDAWMTLANLYNITIGDASDSIKLFQDEFQGRFADEFLGIHAAGHFIMGGDSSDLFSSPNDPVFFLHHAMVDRVYWMWQALHPREAHNIAGTITILNQPPSRDAVKADPLDMGVNADQITIGHALDTLDNTPFCYIYE